MVELEPPAFVEQFRREVHKPVRNGQRAPFAIMRDVCAGPEFVSFTDALVVGESDHQVRISDRIVDEGGVLVVVTGVDDDSLHEAPFLVGG